MQMQSPTLYANAMPVFKPTFPADKLREIKNFNF